MTERFGADNVLLLPEDFDVDIIDKRDIIDSRSVQNFQTEDISKRYIDYSNKIKNALARREDSAKLEWQ